MQLSSSAFVDDLVAPRRLYAEAVASGLIAPTTIDTIVRNNVNDDNIDNDNDNDDDDESALIASAALQGDALLDARLAPKRR